MSGATCKTCGGQVPDGHKPSAFDQDGIGHPAHKTPPDTQENELLRKLADCFATQIVDLNKQIRQDMIEHVKSYGDTRELEGRIDERENTMLPFSGDHSKCPDNRNCIGYQNAESDLYNENLIRINELTAKKDEEN